MGMLDAQKIDSGQWEAGGSAAAEAPIPIQRPRPVTRVATHRPGHTGSLYPP